MKTRKHFQLQFFFLVLSFFFISSFLQFRYLQFHSLNFFCIQNFLFLRSLRIFYFLNCGKFGTCWGVFRKFVMLDTIDTAFKVERVNIGWTTKYVSREDFSSINNPSILETVDLIVNFQGLHFPNILTLAREMTLIWIVNQVMLSSRWRFPNQTLRRSLIITFGSSIQVINKTSWTRNKKKSWEGSPVDFISVQAHQMY